MLSLIIFGAVVSSVAILAVMAKISPVFLKRVLGYEVYIDIAFSVLMGLGAGVGGTISGAIIAIATSAMFGAALFVMARMIGFQRYLKQADGTYKWVEFPATWTVKAAKSAGSSVFSKASDYWNRFVPAANPNVGSLVMH